MSLKHSASQVSPQVLCLLVLYPNIPDEPPKGGCGVRRSPRGWGCLRIAGLFLLSRGFYFVGSPARARCGVLYSDTLSARDGGIPRPMSLLTARVLVIGGSALPQVSTCLLLFSSSVSRHLGLRSSPLTPARLSRAPHSGCDSPPWPLPGVSPFQMQGVCISLTRLLLVIHNTTLTRHHSSSPCLVTPAVAS